MPYQAVSKVKKNHCGSFSSGVRKFSVYDNAEIPGACMHVSPYNQIIHWPTLRECSRKAESIIYLIQSPGTNWSPWPARVLPPPWYLEPSLSRKKGPHLHKWISVFKPVFLKETIWAEMECIESVRNSWKNWIIHEPGSQTSSPQKSAALWPGPGTQRPSLLLAWAASLLCFLGILLSYLCQRSGWLHPIICRTSSSSRPSM